MRILVIGASGMIGSRIAAEASERGHDVTSANRSGTNGALALDAADAVQVGKALAGHDAVVLAVKATATDGDVKTVLRSVANAVLTGMRNAAVSRIMIVGGAGSLTTSSGMLLADTFTDLPEPILAQMDAQAALLAHIRAEADDLEWTYVSPAALIAPSERTGIFRVGSDELLVSADGKSEISAEDYAVGVVDALERHDHVRQRVTFAY